jgi:hypothetical protein
MLLGGCLSNEERRAKNILVQVGVAMDRFSDDMALARTPEALSESLENFVADMQPLTAEFSWLRRSYPHWFTQKESVPSSLESVWDQHQKRVAVMLQHSGKLMAIQEKNERLERAKEQFLELYLRLDGAGGQNNGLE